MSGLIILIGFISLAFTGCFLTRNVRKTALRWAFSFLFPFSVLFCLYPSYLLSITTEKIYCHYNENNIKVYVSPEEWMTIKVDMVIRPKMDFTVRNSRFKIEPESYNFSYKQQIMVDNHIYKLRYINDKNPNLALYKKDVINFIWGRNDYLYYDVVINKPIASINDYYIKYSYPFLQEKIRSCSVGNISKLDNFVDINYLNVK